jgi:hypothetical protein
LDFPVAAGPWLVVVTTIGLAFLHLKKFGSGRSIRNNLGSLSGLGKEGNGNHACQQREQSSVLAQKAHKPPSLGAWRAHRVDTSDSMGSTKPFVKAVSISIL